MAKAKAANYSDEQIATMTRVAGEMTGPEAVTELAAMPEFKGKTIASLRAKLSNMGIYEKPEAAKSTSTRRKKADIVADIVKAGVDLQEHEAEGLEKATAGALTKILARLTN